MVSKEDWSALMSSEVFRNYLDAEMKKQAAPQPPPSEPAKEDVYDQLIQLEAQINKNPQMLKVFAALRQKFISDPDYAAQVDPLFVEGVLMLDLDQE